MYAEVVSSLCYPKSKEYIMHMFGEFRELHPECSEDSLPYCISSVFDISYPVSLFLRLYCLESDLYDGFEIIDWGNSWEDD